MSVTADLMEKAIRKNAEVPMDQKEYRKRYDDLTKRFDSAKTELESVRDQISRKELTRATISAFLKALGKQDKLLSEFDPITFRTLVDHMTVYGKDSIGVTFINGVEIKT